jgi:hypothetical protein
VTTPAPLAARRDRWKWITWLILAATVLQLFVATFIATDLPQFEDKGFATRLVAYPLMMVAVPAIWTWVARRRGDDSPLPWLGFALIMMPFLIDVTGNSLNLYDTIVWWDDANHFVNWLLLSSGIGVLLLRARISPPWALGFLIAGIGALLAIGWELAEWYSFIRHGKELDTAYTDTLGDEALGSLGGIAAGVLVVACTRRLHRPS